MKNLFHSFGLVVLASGLIMSTGCSSGVARNADVSEGDYYSAEEFQKLSSDQRDAYCADLDAELANLEGGAKSAADKAEASEAQIAQVEADLARMQSDYDARKGEVDGVQEEIDYYENLPKVHVVEDGEFLQKISGYERIYADAAKWPRIYRANKDRIEDPNLIYPGWELTIPRDWPTSWTVKQDEFLGKIAGYWEVYDNPADWTKIFEANRDQVSDADMIWPGWELTIPRD